MTTLQTLRLTRRFDAAPERVFNAWTDPQLAAGWLFTGPDSEAHTTEFDLKVGGRWEIVDRRGGVELAGGREAMDDAGVGVGLWSCHGAGVHHAARAPSSRAAIQPDG